MNVGMNVAAESIGRTLARLGQLTSHAPHTELETSRENIAGIVAESADPLSVEDIAGVTGLHANTIRTHLDVLRARVASSARVRTPKAVAARSGYTAPLMLTIRTAASQRN